MAKLSPLASVSETRAVLSAHGLSTKYSLGQNFLINDAIVQKIVALAELSEDDSVLEVGPGIGTLTIALLKHAGCVVSVERDADLPAVLAKTLAPWVDKFALIEKDAVDLTLDDLRIAFKSLPLAPSGKSVAVGAKVQATPPTKFVANLPYAVAATVVLDYFQNLSSLESATIMVQKEVADRMCASPGTKIYGSYTVKLRLFAQPAGRFSVGPNNFFPPPRVESSVLRLNRTVLRDVDGGPVGAALLGATCLMADAAFASRRKTLSNSCKTYFMGRGAEYEYVIPLLGQLFERAGIDARRRGESLDQDEFLKLGRVLQTML